MGIDPDAYMAGAIPSLSRGGSWRQDEPLNTSQSASSHGHAPGGSIFPRPSQIVPQPASTAPLAGNRNNAHFALQLPWGVRPPFAPPHPAPQSVRPMTPEGGATFSTHSKVGGGESVVSGKTPSVGPTKHPGWANLHTGGYRSSPTSPTAPSGASSIANIANSQYGVKPSQAHRATPHVSPRLVEPIWEYASGSPKPLTAEPDYFALPASPGVVTAPHTPSGVGGNYDSLPPPPKPAPQSPRPRPESERPPRPAISRRHTHDRYSPEMLAALERAERSGKVESKSLGRVRAKSGLRKPTFDIGSEAGDSYYAPSKTYAHSVDPPSTSVCAASSFTGQSKSRPSTSRRSTAGPSTASTLTSSPRSFAERRFKNRSHPALPTIASTVHSVQTAPTTPTTTHASDRSRKGSGVAANAAIFDFTQSQTVPNSPSTKAPRSQHPSMDMRSLQDALPKDDPPMASAPLTAPPLASGYVAPNTDDGYDRYTAHPAAPVPPRVDVSTTTTETKQSPMGAGLKHVTADTYRPPGLPKPLKEIGWNRDGPAMRTYGIAWLREGTVDALPVRPAGPRWIQARPPPSTAQSGGSWWESGAS